jgi:hypothetical protein
MSDQHINLDRNTIRRYRADPDQFVEECLFDPYATEYGPYKLIEAERSFVRAFFKFGSEGRLLYPLAIYAAIKKSRKTVLGVLILLTAVCLFGRNFFALFHCRRRSGTSAIASIRDALADHQGERAPERADNEHGNQSHVHGRVDDHRDLDL